MVRISCKNIFSIYVYIYYNMQFPNLRICARLTYVATIQVDRLRLEGDERVTTDLRLLARGPSKVASSFSKFVINGFRFHTKHFDRKSKTQNSGVMVTAKTLSFVSAKDKTLS